MSATGTRPKTRESDEKLRLSPSTKYSPLGTVNGSDADDASPFDEQQLSRTVHVSGRYDSCSTWNAPCPACWIITCGGVSVPSISITSPGRAMTRFTNSCDGSLGDFISTMSPRLRP